MEKTILIADDNKDIVDILKIYAQKEGYKSICAYDGEQALKMWKEYNPVLILLDVMMPKMNGFDVCKQIRQTSNVPIIMVTAKIEEADKKYSEIMASEKSEIFRKIADYIRLNASIFID